MFGITFRKEAEEERWLRKALDGDNTATEWIYRRNRQTLWGGCTDANPKLLLNDT